MTRLIAITGGIGAGKSVVCNVLRSQGFEVYDCDSHAKEIMDTDSEIKTGIEQHIGRGIVSIDGTIDRKALSHIVFNDAGKLQILNRLVHGAVLRDLARWHADLVAQNVAVAFIETAILYQSGLDKLVDEVWEVNAPTNVRIERVKQRNNLDDEAVMARINSQRHIPANPHEHVRTIINDGYESVLEQLVNYEEIVGVFPYRK